MITDLDYSQVASLSNGCVKNAIDRKDRWFVGDQFNYFFGLAKYVYQLRESFIRSAIERIRAESKNTIIKILDIGCGDGVLVYRLSDINNAKFWGIDYNYLRLERAKRLVKHAYFELVEIGSN